MHVRRTRRGVVGHRDDRVRHELTRPVVGHVAATIGALERGPDRGRVDEHVAVVCVRAECIDGRVLHSRR